MKNDVQAQSRVLWCDGQVAVVYKNRGEVCESDAAEASLSLVGNLKHELEEKAGKKLDFLEAVHRIDQPVTGCVLVAFSREAHAALSEQFASGKIRKKYRAIVERPRDAVNGILEAKGGRLEHLIRFDQKHHKATAVLKSDVNKPGPEWKRAALEWHLVGAGDRYSFIEVIPETGRTHQIRAQLAAAGIPIKGDLKYGAKRSDPLGGIRLHAYSIQFTHPVTRDVITVVAPVRDPDNLWSAFPEEA
jgi:23S rRNA pseudouridine1911/1915/1917 synthase